MSGVAYHRAAVLSSAASSCRTASIALEADLKDLNPWDHDAFVPLQHADRRVAPLLAAVVAVAVVAADVASTVKVPFPATAVGASDTSHVAAWKNTLRMERRTAYQLAPA